MTPEPKVSRLQRCVARLVALETRIDALLDRLRGEARDHPATAAAFERLHVTTKNQRDTLVAHLRELDRLTGYAGPAVASGPAPAADAGMGDGPSEAVCTGTVSRAVRAAYLACNEAGFGYGVLHEAAHLSDSLRFAATLRLAERHLRSYARAAQELTQLLPEVVAWELRQEGQGCECPCPACSLGMCWCIAHTTDTINQAWRETAPTYPSAGLRVAPNSRRPPDLDVREGDLVIAVDGHRVATTADVTTAVLSHAPGEPIRLGIERPSAGALEITATRK